MQNHAYSENKAPPAPHLSQLLPQPQPGFFPLEEVGETSPWKLAVAVVSDGSTLPNSCTLIGTTYVPARKELGDFSSSAPESCVFPLLVVLLSVVPFKILHVPLVCFSLPEVVKSLLL